MSDYLASLHLPEPLDEDGVRRLARHACLDLHRVVWKRAFIAADGRMLAWYEALDAESVRLVLRQQGSPEVPVWPVHVLARGDEAAAPRDGVLIELGYEPHLDEVAAQATLAAIVASLERSVQRGAYGFAARSAGRFFLFVASEEDAAVTDGLAPFGVTPLASTRAVQIDPRHVKQFTAHGAGARPDQRSDRPRAEDGGLPPSTGQRGEGPVDVDAVIMGAGVSGICALERLVRMGLRVRAYEAADGIGGVWYWNRYPGARLDSETYTYGYSFSDELLRDWAWQELFAGQPEIERYLQHVVERLDLLRHIRLGARVTSAVYDARRRHWRVETDVGESISARYLLSATGTLSVPRVPDLPGAETFAGESHHTARWPSGGVALSGRRVGVIGTGASGVQVIQTIAPEVQQLTVFQRTPTYCVPQRNRALTEEDRRRVREDWPAILAACGRSYGGFLHEFDPRPGLALSAAAREAKFEELWERPGLAFWFANFADVMMNAEVNAHASSFLRRKIRSRVRDPEVARKLLPSHPFGTKRVPLEDGYYEVFNRSNVLLVDLRETPIEAVTPTGIRTSREEHALDVIVHATGFDAATGALMRIDIRGERGVTLAERWRAGPKTYLGLLVSGFPNLFLVTGPHNAAGLCNAGRCVEQNVDWIARCIEHARSRGFAEISAKPASEDEWTRHVHEVADATLLATMKESWFFGPPAAGGPRQVRIYAGGAPEYRQHCEDVARDGYPGLVMS